MKEKKEDVMSIALVEQRIKFRNSLSVEVQKAMDLFAKKLNELTEHDIKTYELLNQPDCLYGDSPLGRPFTWQWAKQYLIKQNLDFVGFHLDGKVSIREFTEHAHEASNWALRFIKPSQPKKIGIDAITGG